MYIEANVAIPLTLYDILQCFYDVYSDLVTPVSAGAGVSGEPPAHAFTDLPPVDNSFPVRILVGPHSNLNFVRSCMNNCTSSPISTSRALRTSCRAKSRSSSYGIQGRRTNSSLEGDLKLLCMNGHQMCQNSGSLHRRAIFSI